MDKEITDKHYRIVGKLQALEDAATRADCMPCDKTTHALLLAVRGLLQKAVTSAWEYADTNTAQGKPADPPMHSYFGPNEPK